MLNNKDKQTAWDLGGGRAQSHLDGHGGLFPPWPLGEGHLSILLCLFWPGLESRKLSVTIAAGQNCVLSGRAFLKNSLKRNPQLPQADYSKSLTCVSSPIPIYYDLRQWLLFLSPGTKKRNNHLPFYGPSNRLADSYRGFHQHVPLAATLHLAFPLPTLHKSKSLPFLQQLFCSLTAISSCSHYCVQHHWWHMVPRAGSRLPWPSGGRLRGTSVSL